MHPTLHDHVLECALFQKRKPDVRVAILTDDIALKIKALAEVMLVLIALMPVVTLIIKPVQWSTI